MKFENTLVMNFENAIRGMRNPLESWDKSDSFFSLLHSEYDLNTKATDIAINKWKNEEKIDWLIQNGVLKRNGEATEVAVIGPNDMQLCQKLIHAGAEHRKFLRQLFVSVDIEAPLFLLKELDKYQIGVTTNSCSTMHKIMAREFTPEMFECGELTKDSYADFLAYIDKLNQLRNRYLITKDKQTWKDLIIMLPSSWLQMRTFTMNYEVLHTICKQRRGHKLVEWLDFIEWVKTLPYAQELIFCY